MSDRQTATPHANTPSENGNDDNTNPTEKITEPLKH